MTQGFPIHDDTPLRYPGPPPAQTDVVVIGGGIMGVMTAWPLAERGLSVVLCEKGRVAGEQSSRNWGWVRQQGRDLAELPIMMESLRLWQAMAAEMPGIGFAQHGCLYLARSHAEMFRFEAWMTQARGHVLDVRLQSSSQVYDRLPDAAVQWVGGLFTQSDAQAEPWVAVPLLAEGAVRRGAVIVEDCAVRRLDRAAGRVVGVVTELGRIACDQVVVAGGAWSSLFLRAEGVHIPQLSVLATVAQTEPMAQTFLGCLADDRIGLRRRADGGYTIAAGGKHDYFIGPDAFRNVGLHLSVLKREFRSTRFHLRAPQDYPDAWGTVRTWGADEISPFERMRILNLAPNMALLAKAQDVFASAFPDLGRPKVRTAWGGMIDMIPDIVPVVDRVPAVPGLVIATGLCGHGFGIGPGMGRVVADLVAGKPVGHDLSRFRLSRFSDGSTLVPGPTL
jgi:glycine/D-amino acid oxidase-like deaminating enzyme